MEKERNIRVVYLFERLKKKTDQVRAGHVT